MVLTVYIDGSCRPKNPGGIACGGVIIREEGKIIFTYGGVIAQGEDATNNVAEYGALLKALSVLDERKDEKIIIKSDSEMLIEQMNGRKKASKGIYLEIKREVDNLLTRFRDVEFTWVPREKNQEADRIAYKAYQEHVKTIHGEN